MQNQFLTNEEKKAIKVLNFIATYDGVIKSEDDIKYLLQQGIEKFIPKKRRHLVSIAKNAYPIKIIIKKSMTKKVSRNRVLKIWNGRCYGNKYHNHHAYVAAYTMKQAAELLSMAFYGDKHKDLIKTHTISKYYSKGAWGNKMEGIEPIEPCVYLCLEHGGNNHKPIRVI